MGQVCDPKQSDEAEPERDMLDPARPGPDHGKVDMKKEVSRTAAIS